MIRVVACGGQVTHGSGHRQLLLDHIPAGGGRDFLVGFGCDVGILCYRSREVGVIICILIHVTGSYRRAVGENDRGNVQIRCGAAISCGCGGCACVRSTASQASVDTTLSICTTRYHLFGPRRTFPRAVPGADRTISMMTSSFADYSSPVAPFHDGKR